MTTDDCPPHGLPRPDDYELQLADSIAAIHAENSGRPIRCCCGCELTFIRAADYLRHQAQLIHPSRLA